MEARTAVLHRDPPVRDHHARAEAGVVALNERDAPALPIGGAKKDRPAGLRHAGIERLRLRRIDLRGEPSQAIGVEQRFRRSIDEARIRDVAVRIGEAELHRLDLEMQHVGAVRIEPREIEVAKHAERHQRRKPLPVGRDLVEPRAAVLDRDRIGRERLVRREIARPQESAFGSRRSIDRLRDLALIERLALARSDRLERAGMARQANQLARRGRLAIEEKGLAPIGSRSERSRGPLPERRGLRAQEIALLREANRRREQFGERQAPMSPPQVGPERDLSRHGHR